MREKPMKKQDNDMLEEYDFSKGIRGKYAKRYAEGSNVVIIDPEISKEFPDSESVNEALKYLMLIIKKHQKKVKS
jgi:hypothetical protein